MFAGPFDASIIKRAREKGLVQIQLVNIRDFSKNKHRTVDDAPFGGGAGMVMTPEPIFEAVEWVRKQLGQTGLPGQPGQPGPVVLLSPAGRPFNQTLARELSREKSLILVCGHYEGVDERVREHLADAEISIGDYVLTGGELPAMVVVDAVVRLIPGVLGKSVSVDEESFSGFLLEYPQYTRPRQYRGYSVPEILLSGHHGQISAWRRRRALLRTLENRPDLLPKADLDPKDKKILKTVFEQLQKLDLSDA